MGQLYSHLVFRPPPVCSYQSTNGQVQYVVPNEDGLPTIHSTKLIWLLNNMQFRIPCAMVRHPRAEYVALYAHQNAEDLGSSIQDAHILSAGLGIDVLAFEYSGYGLSEKPLKAYPSSRHVDAHEVAPSSRDADRQRAEPSEKACCSDIIAAYTYLTDQCDIHPSKILVFGRSIGSGPAVYCATSKRVGGLVLISPIASAVRVSLKKLNVTLPFIDTFPNIDRASKIKCPVLVVHGGMDQLVPKLHAERLLEKIKQNGNAVTPLWIPTAQHNNVVEDFHSVVFGRCITFLDELKTMKADRKSIDDNQKSLPYHCNLDANSHRPQVRRRQRHPLAFLRPPRVSLDKFSVRAKAGDVAPHVRPYGVLQKSFKGLVPLHCLNGTDDYRDSLDLELCPSSSMLITSNLHRIRQRAEHVDAVAQRSTPSGVLNTSDGDPLQIQTMSWDLFRMSIEKFEKDGLPSSIGIISPSWDSNGNWEKSWDSMPLYRHRVGLDVSRETIADYKGLSVKRSKRRR